MLRLVQLNRSKTGRRVAVVEEPRLRFVSAVFASVYDLAAHAIKREQSISDAIRSAGYGDSIPYDEVYAGQSDWTLLSPIDHPTDPTRCLVTGTGLTHKASADNRQSMHASHEPLTDSMKMFRIGLDGGRPAPGQIGAQPEWFYKGNGRILRSAQGEPLLVPNHGFDGGDEAEIAGVYLNGPHNAVFRLGLCQANEFSDHVLESQNYLYLAASKLRTCSLGPELVVDADFSQVPGRIAVERAGKAIWESPLRSGEANMSHTLANLEHHHFKFDEHRHPGDLHVHFFGADVFSFRDKLKLEDGDVMTLSFDGFGRPLRNPLRIDRSEKRPITVKQL